MKTGKVKNAIRLSSVRGSQSDNRPVIKILTDLPNGQNNAFYMDPTDLQGIPLNLFSDVPLEQNCLNADDDITFDKKDGFFKKCVMWKGRKFRQREYSFDDSNSFH